MKGRICAQRSGKKFGFSLKIKGKNGKNVEKRKKIKNFQKS